ncbi:ubiquitin carboxyl-terminal hydrolase family protein [Pigmentibacter ruber]|uniref:hypothetical protein n=1 Tax=Pigmentibacter ruber TaxID=2683196 RepID=UPI00131CF79B|nr:hypothetical protein [Pigmentibacter ruber]
MSIKHKLIFTIIFGISLISCNKTSKKHESSSAREIPPRQSQTEVQITTKLLSEAVGTENLGNTCFANSVHKLLWSYLRKSNFPLNNNLQREFFAFMESLSMKMDAVYHNPSNVEVLNSKDPFFREALYKIFTEITQTLLYRTGSGSINGLVITKDQIDADEYFRLLSGFFELNETPESFYVSSQIKLKDGTLKPIYTESLVNGKFTKNIYYPINLIKNINNINDLINHNLKETIDGFFDSDTGITQSVEKQTYFTLDDLNKAPNRIILTLKRFTQQGANLVKNTDIVTFPEVFPIHFYSLKDNLKSTTQRAYGVKAVIIHHGTLNGGHYYAYLKEKNKWYKHNDSVVNEVNTSADITAMNNDISQFGYLFLLEQDLSI